MIALTRWLAVGAGLAALIAVPTVLNHLPAKGSDISASDLLSRIDASSSVPYSGYAESSGNTSVPVTGQFSAVADLLGGHTDMRVWWRSGTDWRVDSVNASGEVDLHTSATGTWRWDYERNTATYTPASTTAVRLPADQDLLPPSLGRRVLSEALPSEVSTIASARVAGISAAGLRLRPGQPESTVDHADIWADAATGVVVKVAIYMKGSPSAVVSTAFLDFSTNRPAEQTITFAPTLTAKIAQGDDLDIASAANRFVTVAPPTVLAGLARNTSLSTVGSVGVYGRGITELVAVPVPERFARTIYQQLVGKPGVSRTGTGLSLSVGPVFVFVADPVRVAGSDEGPIVWILAGTVNAATVSRAASQLVAAR